MSGSTTRTELQEVAGGTPFEADVCVIGSGPAGATIAAELAGTPLRVLVVESGGETIDPALIPFDEIESTGAPRVADVAKLRCRTLGGTSAIWSGRCVALQALDLATRDWVPHSGWPINPAELTPYFDRAAHRMRLGPNVYDERLWPLLPVARPEPALDESLVVSSFWQYSVDPRDPSLFYNFGRSLRAMNAPNVRVLTGATVTHITTDPAGRQTRGVDLSDRTCRHFTVRAARVVLAAGGLENARLMLASNHVIPEGVGNAHDQVGRFLMDHPRCNLGHFAPADVEAILARFGLYQLHDETGTHPYSHGLQLSPALQRAEGLLNCAAWLTEQRADDDPWDAIKRLRSGRQGRNARDLLAVLKHPALVARGLHRRLVQGRGVSHKINRLLLDCIVEQRPDPDSRLTLSDRRDPFGSPLAKVHWKISDQEKETVIRFGRAIVRALTDAGLPVPQLVDWVRDGRPEGAVFRDVAHPTGTTRMSADPATGVVDADCQVHGVHGLYAAGSSVFPTSGHGNPTLMLVALATRLADHLKQTVPAPADDVAPAAYTAA